MKFSPATLPLLGAAALACASDRMAGTPSGEVDTAATPGREIDAGARDWPQWRGPDRNGISAERAWASEGAEKPLWSRNVGLGYSAATVVDGRVYTKGFDEERGVDVTWALDGLNGEVLWTFEHPSERVANMHTGGTLSTPVVANGTLYTLSRLGSLYALDVQDGSVRWEYSFKEKDGAETGAFGLPSSPVLLGDRVIVNAGSVYAFDARTGEVEWKTADYGYSYATPEPFEWKGDEYLAVFNAKGLAVLESDGGAERALHPWTSNYNVNTASPVCIGDRIFISTGYNEIGCAMLRFTGDALEVVWESRAMNSKMNGCVLYEDHLYGFDGGILKCLDLDGEEQWRERGLGIGSLTIAGDRLIVLGEKGELLVAPATPEGFTPTTRRKVLETEPCWTMPVLSGGLIYARSSQGELVCLDHRG